MNIILAIKLGGREIPFELGEEISLLTTSGSVLGMGTYQGTSNRNGHDHMLIEVTTETVNKLDSTSSATMSLNGRSATALSFKEYCLLDDNGFTEYTTVGSYAAHTLLKTDRVQPVEEQKSTESKSLVEELDDEVSQELEEMQTTEDKMYIVKSDFLANLLDCDLGTTIDEERLIDALKDRNQIASVEELELNIKGKQISFKSDEVITILFGRSNEEEAGQIQIRGEELFDAINEIYRNR